MPKIICKGVQNKGFGADAVTTGMQIGGEKMPRYIDTEDFKHLVNASSLYGTEEWVKVMDLLADTPTADVVKFVRCKDCVNWQVEWTPESFPNGHYCEGFDGMTRPTFYCAYGERREDEGND